MRLAFGVVCLWLGVACLWVAVHGTDARTPWQAYQQVITGLKNA